jgi:hypothetical protein
MRPSPRICIVARRGEGRPVVELRSLGRDEDSPDGKSWVLVEKRDGRYYVSGRQNGGSVDASVSPAGVDTPSAAIRAAADWADLLSIPYLYVRDD